MAAETGPQILLTGATGYIGGTILSHLLSDTAGALGKATITCLVRGAERVRVLAAAYGERVRPVQFHDLDDEAAIVAVAAEHDLVINATGGYHAASAKALVRGLAQRKAVTGRDVWLIHTSGTSNVAELPSSADGAKGVSERVFDDAKDDVYGFERTEQARSFNPQRAGELGVVDTGLELGVKTLVIMSGMIYGVGTGRFNTASIQIPMLINAALKSGHGIAIGDGKCVWDHVHVEDLAELYRLAVVDVLDHEGEQLPTGKQGIIFSGNGRQSWMDVAQAVADVCYEGGHISDRRVQSLQPEDAAKVLGAFMPGMDSGLAERVFGSDARTVASVASQLGWNPSRGEEAWKQSFPDDLKLMLEKQN